MRIWNCGDGGYKFAIKSPIVMIFFWGGEVERPPLKVLCKAILKKTSLKFMRIGILGVVVLKYPPKNSNCHAFFWGGVIRPLVKFLFNMGFNPPPHNPKKKVGITSFPWVPYVPINFIENPYGLRHEQFSLYHGLGI